MSRQPLFRLRLAGDYALQAFLFHLPHEEVIQSGANNDDGSQFPDLVPARRYRC